MFGFISSLLHRGLFVLWGGWGERKRERAGHDGKGEERREAPAVSLFPSSPTRFLFFRLFYFDEDTQREPLRRRDLYFRYKRIMSNHLLETDNCWFDSDNFTVT